MQDIYRRRFMIISVEGTDVITVWYMEEKGQ